MTDDAEELDESADVGDDMRMMIAKMLVIMLMKPSTIHFR